MAHLIHCKLNLAGVHIGKDASRALQQEWGRYHSSHIKDEETETITLEPEASAFSTVTLVRLQILSLAVSDPGR
jgi:hypothetical protein